MNDFVFQRAKATQTSNQWRDFICLHFGLSVGQTKRYIFTFYSLKTNQGRRVSISLLCYSCSSNLAGLINSSIFRSWGRFSCSTEILVTTPETEKSRPCRLHRFQSNYIYLKARQKFPEKPGIQYIGLSTSPAVLISWNICAINIKIFWTKNSKAAQFKETVKAKIETAY